MIECEEYGGCAGSSGANATDLWSVLRRQIASGMPKDSREEEMKEYDKILEDMQAQDKHPPGKNHQKTLAWLNRAEAKAKDLEELEKQCPTTWLVKGVEKGSVQSRGDKNENT